MQELTFEQMKDVSGGISLSTDDMLHELVFKAFFRHLNRDDGSTRGGRPPENIDNYPGQGLPPP